MRLKNSIKNMCVGTGSQLLTSVLNFISRTIFIYTLGSEYLGLNGLFTNILSMLSLAELGIASSIIYCLYKPLANKNEEEISSLMNLYSKLYKIIGIIIAILGIIILPLLQNIFNQTPDILNLNILYLLFLANSVISYFFAYKRSILVADQKNYIVITYDQIFNTLKIILQVIILLVYKSYIGYLIIQIIFTFISNIYISYRVDKIYTYLKYNKKIKVSEENKKKIFKNVLAMMSHKIGNVIVNGTDNILISNFVGITWVGLYSNYIMIINILNSFLLQLTMAVTGSVGNLNSTESEQKQLDIFEIIFFLNFWVYSMVGICFIILVNPFIQIWIGTEYVLDKYIVFMITINFIITGLRQPIIVFKNTNGLFLKDKYKPIFESVINLIVSIILLQRYGLVGVIIGTFISTLTTSFWIEPYILYKYAFNADVKEYFLKWSKYIGIMIGTYLIVYILTMYIGNTNLLSIFIKGILSICVINICYIITFIKTKEFKEIQKIITKYLIKDRNYF